MSEAYEPRLKTRYREAIRPAMRTSQGYTNEMQIPKLDKVVTVKVLPTGPSELQLPVK